MGDAIIETNNAPVATSMFQVIERVSRDDGVDIAKFKQLLDMQKELRADDDKRAYALSFAAMQGDLPEIPENGKSHNGKYALWEDINDLVKPVLSKHGFGISFRNGTENGKISITCILTHKDGHSEQTTMELPADSSGSKNAVQAIGSTTSYGKRYTAQAILNLTSRNEDDDGRAAAKPRERVKLSAEKGKKYLNFTAMCDEISKAEGRKLSNLQQFYTNDCDWLPSGWAKGFLDKIKERDEELESGEAKTTQSFEDANAALDRQFADTMA